MWHRVLQRTVLVAAGRRSSSRRQTGAQVLARQRVRRASHDDLLRRRRTTGLRLPTGTERRPPTADVASAPVRPERRLRKLAALGLSSRLECLTLIHKSRYKFILCDIRLY